MAKNFAVSGQHYLFSVQAFAHTILTMGGDVYDYAYRDRSTAGIIDDVKNGTSELGIIVETTRTKDKIEAALAEAGLKFVGIKESRPMIALSASHPLSNASSLKLEQLESWPYLYFEQRPESPVEFCEEALSDVPRKKTIACNDRASLSELAVAVNGYTVTSGILVGITDGGSLATVPLETDETLCLGYVVKENSSFSPAAERFVEELTKELNLYAK
ncbi:MAG: LysR family transcriptional regulator substrate-binding protein [Phoenicibacter congonensis]|uniref:LysR family transcriptional regulator substrate-binding protein n=1 Tax=Phoenicibacter congonensis TaxID=1944646 RepID=A0AA43UB76_9ACTN|nr:LysR family transcriptional regulator substrate-binding protein [Phoenicibacter congonensis]